MLGRLRNFFSTGKSSEPWLVDLSTALGHNPLSDIFRNRYRDSNSLELSPAGPFLELCLRYSNKNAPAKKWADEARVAFEEVPAIQQQELILAVLRAGIDMLQRQQQSLRSSENVRFFRADIPEWLSPLVWYAGKYLSGSGAVCQALNELADLALRKSPGAGALAAKTGVACLRALSFLPDNAGVPALMRFQKKISNRNIRNTIDKILEELAAKNHLTKGELKELSVPDFGLGAKGSVTQRFGEFEATLFLENQSSPQIAWRRSSDGKALKSPPAVVKTDFPFELQALRQQHKELKSALGSYAATLESAWLERRSWTFEQLTSKLLQHPVLKAVASRLIWRFDENGRHVEAIFHDKRWQDAAGETIAWMQPATQATLWHPISSNAEQVLAWRNWLQAHVITQPFKQAYREIYVVTPPELRTHSYSNRFAAHILRQAQFAALANLRDWHFKAPGMYEDYSAPWREVPEWQYRIEFWISAGEDANDYFDFQADRFVFTDQVRFSHQGRQVNVDQVPPLLFSEFMRDVDLFVGVCSIGNDPDWQDTGDERFREYWQTYAFAEELSANGEVRMEALKRIVPRLKIAPICRFEGKYLLVEGKKHTYKIHCGSGNILMSPNDQYLCIVPDQSARQSKDSIYLPFEGDSLLSIIISKALMLAADDQITDPTILRQI